jgi:hypothetical protein
MMGQMKEIFFVGYKNESTVFYNPKEFLTFTMDNHGQTQILTKYPKNIIVKHISDSLEYIYNIESKEYTIIISQDSFKLENSYKSIAIDMENRVIFAHRSKNHKENPLQIFRLNLLNGKIDYTGLKGYPFRVIGENLFFYIETSSNADSPYDIFIANKKKLELPERIFENQSLNLDFEVSVDGKMIFGRSYQKTVIINIETKEEQIIKQIPIYNFNELPPIFSYDRKFLIFYQSEPFKIKKTKIIIH